MKKKHFIHLSPLFLFLTVMAHAQGTIYLSNISQPFSSGDSVANDSWFAQYFLTGTNSGGYALDSIQLLMNPASGSPNGFTVSIYSSAGGVPNVNLLDLTGSDPSAGGIFTYSADGITLLPSTFYYIVSTASTPLSQGSYSLSLATAVYSSSENWQGAGLAYGSPDGFNWSRAGGIFQYAVTATAVPEPATYVLLGLGLVCLSFCRRKPRQLK